jgi:hypothetical protein
VHQSSDKLAKLPTSGLGLARGAQSVARIPRRLAGLIIAVYLAGSTGCQHAYNDFYTESMAGEIRELENRIYEYDEAYQSLEQEVGVLESENARLHRQVIDLQKEHATPRGSNSLLTPKEGVDLRGPAPSKVPSADHLPPAKNSSSANEPKVVPKVEPLEPPPTAKPASPSPTPKPAKEKPNSADLEPPLIELGVPSTDSSLLPPSSEALPTLPAPVQPKSPSSLLPPPVESQPSPGPSSLMPPTTPPASLTPPSSAPSSLTPPSLPPANPTPPSILPPPAQGGQGASKGSGSASQASIRTALPESLDWNAIGQDQIAVPDALAAEANEIVAAGYQPPPSKRVPGDQKVAEIGLHPSMCRGQNMDEQDGDDGLYLVLQPRNQSGETVDQPAAVTIVAIDPKLEEADARIGRWTFSLEEVEAALEPIGVAHGYHLSLPWQGLTPAGDSVQVFVRYEMPDGRRLINERLVYIHQPDTASNVWTPRVRR